MRRALPLALAIAAFLVAALIWIGSSRTSAHAFDRDSISNTSPTGLSLAFAYLARQPGRIVKTLTTHNLPPDAIVIRVEDRGPEQKVEVEADEDDKTKGPSSLLTPAEDEFVRNGGRLVLARDYAAGSLQLRNNAGRSATKVFPIWPGVETITLPESRGFAPRSLPRGMHTLFAANGTAIIARQPIGKGELFLISVPELFENQNIAIDGHLALLAALVDGSMERRPLAGWRSVYFDEVVHGMAADDGMLALMTEWRLGPLLLLAGIAALLTFWRNSKRIGPAEDEDRDTRSDAVDLVASLGALYGRSMSSAESIALYHDALARSVAAHSGLRGDALHRRIDELTHGLAAPRVHESLAAPEFQLHLTTINEAFRTLERSARGGHHANHC